MGITKSNVNTGPRGLAKHVEKAIAQPNPRRIAGSKQAEVRNGVRGGVPFGTSLNRSLILL